MERVEYVIGNYTVSINQTPAGNTMVYAAEGSTCSLTTSFSVMLAVRIMSAIWEYVKVESLMSTKGKCEDNYSIVLFRFF